MTYNVFSGTLNPTHSLTLQNDFEGVSPEIQCLLSWYFAFRLPSNRHHLRCGDRLEGKGENYQVCSVQYCVQQLCTVRCTHI